MVLKQYLRGSILVLTTLIALSVIVTITTTHALAVLESIHAGEVPMGSGSITELVSDSISSADSSIVNVALIVVGACWLIGIIDCLRAGIAQEE